MKYLILLLLISCGKAPQQGYTTPRLQALIANFEQDFDLKVGYSVKFVKAFTNPPPPNQIGVCATHISFRYVELLSTYETSFLLPPLVYHELGHCSLNLAHYDEVKDIMNTVLWPELGTNFEEYRQEMIFNWNNFIYP